VKGRLLPDAPFLAPEPCNRQASWIAAIDVTADHTLDPIVMRSAFDGASAIKE